MTNYFLPEFWARPEAKAKLQFFRPRQNQFNTLFVGTSRIYHHVVCAMFDSLAAANGMNICSFNLGVPALPFPQSYLMIESAVLHNPNVKYVIYELNPPSIEIPEAAENTPENYFWYDWTQLELLREQ